jgi:hypothetical protein
MGPARIRVLTSDPSTLLRVDLSKVEGRSEAYFVTVPHAIRAPALPAGSDFMSSAAA